MADSTSLRLVVVTPERAELDMPATSIILPMFDGERGILPGHSSFVGQLGPGELRIGTGSATDWKRYFIDGGFVQVSSGVVNVLTAKAIPSEKITIESATAARTAAEALPSNNPVERESRTRAIARAQGMTAVARENAQAS